MGGRMRDKRRPPSPKAIRRAAPVPAVKRAALAHLHQLPPSQLQQVATATASEIMRLQTHVKQTQGTIADLRLMQSLIERLEAQRTPARDGAVRLSHAEMAADTLAAVGHPMQLKDLLAAMASRGAVVAGKTERQRRSNLIITLGRSPLVRRVGHGVYALTESRASA
jgi:hypothetical protein